MTPKAEALIDGLLDACIDSDNISADYQALVTYIEELERKAQLLDGWQRFERLEHERIMYDVDGNPSAVV